MTSAELMAGTAALLERIERLETRQLIQDVYARYMRGFDRNDAELLRSAFWPDAQINYVTQQNTVDQFVTRHLDDHTHELESYGHLLTNLTIDVDHDEAHVESYVTAFWRQKEGGEPYAAGATIASGRYLDRLERRSGEWRILVREFVEHFRARTEQMPSSRRGGGDADETQWTRRDVSYRRPLLPRP